MSARRDDDYFNQCLRSLARYRENRGTFDIPSNYIDTKGRKVGAWLYRNRRAYEDGRLAEDRLNRFLEIGYDFEGHRIVSAVAPKTPPRPAAAAAKAASSTRPSSSKSKKDSKSTPRVRVDTWDKNFDRLVKFKKEHGHLVPDYNTHKALRMWVNKQQEKWYYGDLEDDRAERLRKLGVPEPESDDTDEEEDEDQDGDNKSETSKGGAAAAGAAVDDEDLASWEAGIATRSAKKKRKMELGEFLSSPNAKRPATAGAAAAAAANEQEPQPSFLSCVYQAVSEKVSSFFFSKNAAAAAATNK